MKTNHDRALETFRVFPYIAWALVIVFALFVYKIAVELQTVANDLKIQTAQIQKQVNTPVSDITDFER